jgi:DNA-binding transcriptional MerR regulator
MAHQGYNEKIEKIEKVVEKAPASLEYESFVPETRLAPNKDHFDQLMSPSANLDVQDVRKVSSAKDSVVEDVAKIGNLVDQAQRGSPQALIAQAQETIQKMEELKEKLRTPNLEIKSSVQEQLRNKLSHIDDNLKIALNRSGIEYTPPPAPVTATTPIERFLGYITDSQTKLNTLTDDINRFAQPGAQLSPATMLVLQMKVGLVQQQVELFSGLLNKSLESTKTIMNVQV